MATCDECGEYENLPYQCHRCGRTFCANHRLPENHDCPGLDEWNDPGGVFDSGFDDSVQDRGGPSSGGGSGFGTRVKRRVERETSTGGLVSYFRGNMTFVFLGLMWVTFFLQFLVALLFGGAVSESLFVLRSANLEYVWTWITSIFAHGGFGHIAINSIVLYFFGPPVERQLGTRRYVGLFLGAGIIASAAQIGSGFLLGDPVVGVVGASGAIMAVMGVLTVLNPKLKVYLYFVLPMPLWLLTVGFAAFSIFAGLGALDDNVAHFAHLGGLVVGLAYGQYLKDELRAPNRLQFGGGGGSGGSGGPGGPGGPGRF
ncbi:rhomboid family protein [Halalkaliarchaeum desulfuricum]|uniref:Rhomboid family protein n=1 Tax=Halalkaliarchaeum desulfuricum TaxID=2055893 RepID=A0A343TF62_9EURY|nr:rhomboid family intramembrane serine protease [Halalkaliarchaeum desulfuricum]AUX07734.1 rhomboid family protein [Halalkaliarchaeum desulfuricum]